MGERPAAEGQSGRSGAAGDGEVEGHLIRICLEAVKSRHGLARVTAVGKILPLHCGAAGKVLLAYLSDKERKKNLHGKPLSKFTPITITDPALLEADLERIRRDGYAVSVGEREDGTYSVVAPVMGGKGEIVASLSISGPIFRLSEEQKAANIQAVLKASREISALLGGADSRERITK
ncbi:MAG: IclR family transcriptional regulator [Deltaproteobacteria bacterium]|nr:IclR family transcriptional regulator [Deltaproteobacteria bacterium]